MSLSKPRLSPSILLLAAVCVAALALPDAVVAAGFATDAGSDAAGPGHGERYRAGQRALSAQNWDEAAAAFADVVAAGGPDVDAGLYWKAYADWKALRKREALDCIQKLTAGYPQSSWVDDARALEIEIRGGAPNRDTKPGNDEELKLYALDALLQVEPEKAVPVLERILAGGSSLELKKRALFVLSQSDSPRAREILAGIARTGQPQELRLEAIQMFGVAGEPEDIAALAKIGADPAAPIEVREAVVEAYLVADRAPELIALAKADPDPRVRAKAIETLGAMEATDGLRQLWASERDPKLRQKLLEALGLAGDVETLAKAARESAEPEVRRQAIEGLGIADDAAAGAALRALYGTLADPGDRRAVLESFMVRDDAKSLIELFRAERDPAMKKAILQQLSVMDDPAASDLLMSILEEKP